MDNQLELNLKWQKLWTDRYQNYPSVKTSFNQQEIVGGASPLENRIFQLLVTAYTQPNRHYHNLDHISHLLTTIDRFAPQLHNPHSVLLAVWFHDFVYDSQTIDNELQSAKVAKMLLTDLSESTELIDRVQQLILATQGHQLNPNDSDLCMFLDADLAILGADHLYYQTYQNSIRCEYSWATDVAYKLGRTKFLKSLLQRDRIYYTPQIFNQLESIARLNIQQEIAALAE